MRSFATELFGALSVAREPVLEVSARLVGSGRFPELARPWLTNLHHIIQATTPTLQHARKALLARHGSEHFDRELLFFYAGKIRGESGHDAMMGEDLGMLGGPVAHALPDAAVAAMCGSQFYLIDFVHPCVYLGFVALLEGFQPTPENLDEAILSSGAPEAAWRTLRMHASLDVGHKEELRAMLEQVPEIWRLPVVLNGIRCAEFQRQMLETLRMRLELAPEVTRG